MRPREKALAWALALGGCGAPDLIARTRPASDRSAGTGLSAETGLPDASGDTAGVGSGGPCPPDMVLTGGVCVDRFEASLEGRSPFEVAETAARARNGPGEVPQGYVSADVAAASCALAGKRLCTSEEWLGACRGPELRVYPYGDTYDPAACNDTRATHPVIEVFGADATFSSTELEDPRLNQLADSLAPSGEFSGCVTPDGVYDLHGNLHEWVDDPDGTFRGGFYVDAALNGPGCTYVTTAHVASYRDYSTGFRCCTDPR